MKKYGFRLMIFLLVACTLLLSLPLWAAATGNFLGSATAVLMDADTGEVLYNKQMNQQMYPASITKIMTGMLVLEHCNTDETVWVSANAANVRKGYAHIALQAGDTISVDDAMYAMMLPSANDAATALAEHVAGSTGSFASLMNYRAAELGARNTNFVNANGMLDRSHYTTAYDMALITRAAIRQEGFLDYFGATTHTLPALNHLTQETEVSNYQFMLLEDKIEYNPYVIGGKIGYTPQAAHTMSTVATRDGKTLICVVMGSGSTAKYDDTQYLLDYGFSA